MQAIQLGASFGQLNSSCSRSRSPSPSPSPARKRSAFGLFKSIYNRRRRSLLTMQEKAWVMYGSQTGQAEAIASEAADRLSSADVPYQLLCMDEAEPADPAAFFAEKRLFVFVLSSTGDGDPPDNAAKFLRRLNDQSLPTSTLGHVRYALLSLGDSNYSTFHGCPKKFQARLTELGAKAFYEAGWADDAVGLEKVVEPWLEELPKAAKDCLAQPLSPAASLDDDAPPPDPAPAPQADDIAAALATKVRIQINSQAVEPLSPVETSYDFPSEGPCLIRGSEELSKDDALRVPVAAKPFLSVTLTGERLSPDEASAIPWQNGSEFPGSAGGLRDVTLASMTKLTKDGSKADKWEMVVELGPPREPLVELSVDGYAPGDALYFLFPNPQGEVDFVLERLGLEGEEEVRVGLAEGASKPYPSHVPERLTPRLLLRDCVDLRRTPGRPLLRILADTCESASDRRRLMELSSSQGSSEMLAFVRKAGVSLVDLLAAFPSAKPPLARLVEMLPRLQPRAYSVASSRPSHGTKARFAFSAVSIPKGDGRAYDRKGLATGFLLGRPVPSHLRVLYQEPKYFRLPRESPESWNLVFVGPGTGVTPFLGFLHLLKHLDAEAGTETGSRKCARHLFFGARQLQLDGIYLEEMVSLEADGTLDQLHIAESQPNAEHQWTERVRGRYVQDAMRKEGRKLAELLVEERTQLFVCGDAKAMSKDVFAALLDILKEHGHLPDQRSPIQHLQALKAQRRYVEDVWG